MKLCISQLVLDAGTQVRGGLDRERVAEYAEAMREGAVFPPVKVIHDGQGYIVWDGFHTAAAAATNGETSVETEVTEGTVRDAILRSCGANGTHGLPRTNADKRRAVTRLLQDAEWGCWSNRAIANACGVSHEMVRLARDELQVATVDTCSDRRLGADGKEYTLPVPRPLGAAADNGEAKADAAPGGPGRISGTTEKSAADPERTCWLLDEVHEELDELEGGPIDQMAAEPLEALVESAAALHRRAQAMLDKVRSPPADGGQCADSDNVLFGPVMEAVHKDLSPAQQTELGWILHRQVWGIRDRDLEALRDLCEMLVDAGLPRPLAEEWFERLTETDDERRGPFALWFHRRSRLPGIAHQLNGMRKSNLPPALRQWADALWTARKRWQEKSTVRRRNGMRGGVRRGVSPVPE